MTVAALETKDDTAAGVKRKRVRFEETQFSPKKNHGRKLRKKSSKKQTDYDVRSKAKHNEKAESTQKKKDDMLEKIVTPQMKRASGSVTPPKIPRGESISVQRSPSDLKPSASGGELKPVKGEKKTNADGKDRWPFIDFKEQLKLDTFDLPQLAKPKQQSLFSSFLDTSNLMRPLDVTDRLNLNLPTFRLLRRSSVGAYGSHEAMDVLNRIQEEQKKRQQERIKSELKSIQSRVRRTLEEVGMEEDEEYQQEQPQIQTFDTGVERKKMQERNYIMWKVEKFESTALLRNQYLTELMLWFEDHLNICEDLVTPTEMKEMMAATQELHKIISASLKSFIENGKKVVEKGKLLLAETSKIIAERQAQMEKKTKKERITVYDDKTLMSDESKWDSAAKTILSVFEDSHKMIKNVMFKNAIRLCQRQFDYMMQVCDIRFKEIEEKKKQCIELQGKLHSAKLMSDKLTKENEEQKKRYTKLSQELADSKAAFDKLQVKNQDLKEKIVMLNSQIKTLEGELLHIKNRTPTPPPTPPPPPEPEKIYVKVVDSSTDLRLREVEVELENAKGEIEVISTQLNEVSEQFQAEQDKNKQLEEKIVELETAEPPEPVPPPPVTPVIEIPPIELRRSSDAQEKDINYYKTLMVGMKRDFEIEIEKVKSHVRKEKTRGEASLKKMELQHKDQLTYFHKDTVRMLRAIMHFREHMLTCIEKENLIDQAQALQDLGDIIKDKLSLDPKEVAGSIVGTVVEYMNKMEGILSNSFLAMRVLMKYQIDRQVEMEVQQRIQLKEVQKKDGEVKGTKKNVKDLAKSLKKVKNKLKKAKKDADDFTADKKYQDLLSRYNTMMKMYKNMQKEMEVLHSDFNETMKRKLEERETMVISQIKTQMGKRRVLAEEQLKISIADQKQNLQMLGKAYEENKISKDLHMMATAMIQKTMEIPRRKLKNLFEQYITYKTVQDSKARVVRVLRDDTAELSIDTRREMEQYAESLESKFTNSMAKWRNEMEQLEIEKRELHRRIFKLFNEVLIETGVLFVHPLLRGKDKATNLRIAASQMNRYKLQEILFKKKNRCKEFLSLPAELLGKAVTLGHGDTKLWKPQDEQPASAVEASVVAPHLLAYDVNKQKIDALRQLRLCRQRYHLGKTESFNITQENYIQFIRDIPMQHPAVKSQVVN